MSDLIAVGNITSSATLSELFDAFLVDASGGNILVTLPNPAADGLNYYITRTDNSGNTVTVDGLGGETIDGNPTIQINPTGKIYIFCKNNLWYTGGNNLSGISAKSNSVIFCTSLMDRSDRPYFRYSSRTNTLISAFYYSGSTVHGNPNVLVVVVGTSSSSSGEATLRNGAGDVMATISWKNSGSNIISALTTSFTNIPSSSDELQLYSRKTGGDGEVQMHSFILR
jgi:hypothetical protein